MASQEPTGEQAQRAAAAGSSSFGAANVRNLANVVPAQVENEKELLQTLRAKLGPTPDEDRLLYHIRSARGKLHWAVNSYLREAMSQPNSTAEQGVITRAPWPTTRASHSRSVSGVPSDAEREVPFPCSCNRGCESSAPATTAAEPSSSDNTSEQPSVSLDHLPVGILEAIVRYLPDPHTMVSLAMTCAVFNKVANSDWVWQQLYQHRWDEVTFPTHPGGQSAAGSAAAALRRRLNPAFRAHTHHHNNHHQPAAVQHAAAQPAAAQFTATQQQQQQTPFAVPASTAAPAGLQTQTPSSTIPTSTAGPSSVGPSSMHSRQPGPSDHPRRPSSCDVSSAECSQHTLACERDVCGGMSVGSRSGCDTPTTQVGAGCVSSAAMSRAESASVASHTQGDGTGGSGGWKQRYQRQLQFEMTRSCPVCGARDGCIVPLLYGFPSATLLEGMRCGRLILGGDHLIEDAHCWVCTACNASFRTYPYESPQLWVEDHKQQRAASLKTLNPGGDQGAAGAQGLPPAAAAAAGAEGGAVHVGVGAHQQGQGGEGAGDGEAAAGEYLPVAYTYEL